MVLRSSVAICGAQKHSFFRLNLDKPLLHNANCPLRIYAEDVRGVVVNMANIHWVAFRVRSGHIWHVDSCSEPRIVTYSEYLNFLAKYESRAYAVETIN